MYTMKLRHFVALSVLAASVLGCVASPSALEDNVPAATGNNLLAASFDSLAAEQREASDTERSEEFRWAALAVRAGVTPSTFAVNNDGTAEVYNAFVHTAQWTLPTLAVRPSGHRALIAWRKNGDVMQVIIVTSHTDDAIVLHPYSMRLNGPGGVLNSPVAAASAAYFERLSRKSAWMGISGQTKISLQALTGACASPTANAPPAGVTCQVGTFDVAFDIMFAKTRSVASRVVDQSANTRHITASQQTVAGVKLTFSCILPASDKGCN